jgi:hypothetical protein
MHALWPSQSFGVCRGRPGRFGGSGSFYAPLWAILQVRSNQTRRSRFGNEIGYRELVRHLPESTLEDYALGRLSKYRADRA